jgi:hypothetical protein
LIGFLQTLFCLVGSHFCVDSFVSYNSRNTVFPAMFFLNSDQIQSLMFVLQRSITKLACSIHPSRRKINSKFPDIPEISWRDSPATFLRRNGVPRPAGLVRGAPSRRGTERALPLRVCMGELCIGSRKMKTLDSMRKVAVFLVRIFYFQILPGTIEHPSCSLSPFI